jgi:dTDP-4-dehydrorhamnose reductase
VRALITGAGGQLARELVATAPAGIQTRAVSRAECDITDSPIVETVVASFRPDIVINAAAYTAVDEAEENKELAFRVNAGGAENVAKAVERFGSRLIHLSTDYVFDGTSSTPYPPEARTNPINVYGASKLAGEEAVRASGASYVILRCGWIYSAMPGNFLTKMLGHMQSHRSLRVVDDQVGVPTTAAEVARVIWWCAGATALVKNSVLHWASAGSASRYEFAVAIQELALEAGLPDMTDAIVPVKSSEYCLPARRPQYSVLDAGVTWKAMGGTPPHWRVPLANTIAGMARGAIA